jgi:hypothetical protein
VKVAGSWGIAIFAQIAVFLGHKKNSFSEEFISKKFL